MTPIASLLLRGQFTLNSGAPSHFKIDCDALDDVSIRTAAFLLNQRLQRGGAYGAVYGVPRGGLRLAAALVPYCDAGSTHILVVDDVWTTGGSLTEAKQRYGATMGVVLFARNPVPWWVIPLFTLTP